MSETNPMAGRSEEEIQAHLDQTRRMMSATIDQLMAAASPSTQAKQAAWVAQDKAKDFKAFAAETVEDARGGDREAMKKLAIAAGAAALVVALWVIRRS